DPALERRPARREHPALLLERQRRRLAERAERDEPAAAGSEHRLEVARQEIEVERQVLAKRRRDRRENAFPPHVVSFSARGGPGGPAARAGVPYPNPSRTETRGRGRIRGPGRGPSRTAPRVSPLGKRRTQRWKRAARPRSGRRSSRAARAHAAPGAAGRPAPC